MYQKMKHVKKLKSIIIQKRMEHTKKEFNKMALIILINRQPFSNILKNNFSSFECRHVAMNKNPIIQ